MTRWGFRSRTRLLWLTWMLAACGGSESPSPAAGPWIEDTFDNGKVDPGEECDDGNLDSQDGCLANYTLARCGDNIVRLTPPEQAEECDDGNTVNDDSCTANCRFAACGDGILQYDEDCDAGVDDDSGGCPRCAKAFCGDGFVHDGVEGCDDGNNVPNDDCSNHCSRPSCGDGIVQPDEVCDDGNDDDEDGCTRACFPPACGDGVVQADEECDSPSGAEYCTWQCRFPRCGNGVREEGEECDEGNAEAGDGCSRCDREPRAVSQAQHRPQR